MQAEVEYVDAVMFLNELLKMLDMRNKRLEFAFGPVCRSVPSCSCWEEVSHRTLPK